eukprot:5833738-Pyramimonas_sp.AAC.1
MITKIVLPGQIGSLPPSWISKVPHGGLGSWQSTGSSRCLNEVSPGDEEIFRKSAQIPTRPLT